MPESERVLKLLVLADDAAMRRQLSAELAPHGDVTEAADAGAALQAIEQRAADLVVGDAAVAPALLAGLAGKEDAPPVIIVGPVATPELIGAGTDSEAFARIASATELRSWITPAVRFRRLQMEKQLIQDESERIYGGLVKSFGDVAEHSYQLEQEVKRRTVELQENAERLEREVEERTQALHQSNAQLVQQEKMAALGALVAGIAHDMHTPIGTITSNSDVMTRSLGRLKDLIAGEGCPDTFRNNPELKRVLGIIEEISRVNQLACDRIVGIVRSLRNFARLDEAEIKQANLHEGIESTLTLVHHELKNRITVKREFGDIPSVPCHPNQLNQVFMNMLVNASHAMPEKGTITIRTFREGDIVKIQISDSGSGIKPEHLAKIFDPGFTTKGVGVGTGLGLAICYKIVQDHKGTIDVESEVGRGTTFTISLPVEWKTSP